MTAMGVCVEGERNGVKKERKREIDVVVIGRMTVTEKKGEGR